ncbi:sensor histidine kinase [Flavobacterium channae]|uniref:sensor histidine kinase n=1 Tax=Flavobacterium channae TaxID=2897181 RepID=UPI001E449B74|nr:sensor histidine kinase [Flavobacterium channae]UGS22921.1 sensor histidine kinase [Flavobacterium channae]
MNTFNLENSEVIQVVLFILLAFISMFLVLILFFYFSRRKIVQIEVAKKNLEIDHQKELLNSILITQEEERKRIAQDLHDDISSKLNVVSLNSHLLKTPNLNETEQLEITNNIIELTQKALENSRRIAHDLLPPVLEKFGLHAGIEELVEEFNSTKSVKVSYENSIDFESYPVEKHLHIFRILQELLNNSLRHGKATIISIHFTTFENRKTCVYVDNGLGFDSSDSENQKGLGMKNIESRINFLGGNFSFTSKPNQGVKMEFNFN